MSSIYNACYHKPKGDLCSVKDFIHKIRIYFFTKNYLLEVCPVRAYHEKMQQTRRQLWK